MIRTGVFEAVLKFLVTVGIKNVDIAFGDLD